MSKKRAAAGLPIQPFHFVGAADPSQYEADPFAPIVQEQVQPVQSRTWGQAAGDTGAAVMSGLAGLVKSGGDLYGVATGNFDNTASELGANAQQFWQDAQSDVLKAKKADRAAKIAAQEGVLGKFGTAIKETVTDPALIADSAAENIATVLPGAAVGRLAAGAKYGSLMAGAMESGPVPAAVAAQAAKTAAKWGVAGAVGTAAVQQGADVSGDTYADALKTSTENLAQNPVFAQRVAAGEDPQAVARDLASQAGRAAFLPATAISVAANSLPGGMAFERALIGGMAKMPAKNVATGVIKGMLGEGAQEAIEEGGGALSGNVAKQQLVNPNQDLMDQVGENAGLGAAGGIILGGAGGAFHGPAHVQDNGPLSRGANQAIDHGAASVQGAAPTLALPAPTISVTPSGTAVTPEQRNALIQQGLEDKTGGIVDVTPVPQAPGTSPFVAQGPQEQIDASNRAIEFMAKRAAKNDQVYSLEVAQNRKEAMAERGVDATVLPHPSGEGFFLVPTTAVAPFMRNQAPQEFQSGMLPAPDMAVPGAPLVDDGGQVRPQTYADQAQSRAVQARQQAEAQRKASLGLTPDVEQAGAMHGLTDPIAGDIMLASGKPFKSMPPVRRALKKYGGEIVQVRGGWVVRPAAQEAKVTHGDAGSTASVPADVGGQGAPVHVPSMGSQSDGHSVGGDAVHDGNGHADEQPGGRSDGISAVADGGTGGLVNDAVTPLSISGSPIDKEWTAFAPESGTLGIPRAEMPQVKAEHRGAMVNFLNARGVEHEGIDIPSHELKPTQAEFSPSKVEKAKAFDGGDRSILVSEDGHVLDGHHQWLAKREAGDPVKAIRLKAPIKDLLEHVKEFPSAEAANGATEAKPTVEQQSEQREPDQSQQAPADVQAAPKPDQAASEKLDQPEKPNPKEKKAGRIKDAGDELFANRRNHIKGLRWDDINDDNDALKVKQAKREKVWPKPDYASMVADGMPVLVARLVKQVYDGIAPEPKTRNTPTDEQLKAYMDVVARIQEKTMEWAQQMASNPALLKPDNRSIIDAINHAKKVPSLVDMVWPVDDGPGGIRGGKFALGKPNNTEAILVGRNAVKAMQIDSQDIRKAEKDIQTGWPAKREAWQVQGYQVGGKDEFAKVAEVAIYRDGSRQEGFAIETGKPKTYRTRANGFYRTQQEAADALQAMHPWLLLDDAGKLIGSFASEEEAKDAARQKVAKEKTKEFKPGTVKVTDAKRDGPQHRQGDATAQSLIDTFGFRGVNFGNWVGDKERQLHVNHAFDAFMDLADIMGVPPKTLGLNGSLGIAFGAQGNGGRAMAHFVPGINEINITKTSGAGALAHEFAHALDHYFAVQNGEASARAEKPYLTAFVGGKSAPAGVRPKVFDAFKQVLDVMRSRPATEQEAKDFYKTARDSSEKRWDRAIKQWGKDAKDQAAFDEIAARLRSGDVGDVTRAVDSPLIDQLIKASGHIDRTDVGWLMSMVDTLHDLRDEVRFLNTHRPQQLDTEYFKESRRADANRKDAYWSTPYEMFARAFSDWTRVELAKDGRLSGYLDDNQGAQFRAAKELGMTESSPFLDGEELNRVSEAIKTLVSSIEVKDSESGNPVMFSRRSNAGNQVPDAIIAHRLGDLNNHPEYEKAKAGDSAAAFNVAADLVDQHLIDQVSKVAGKDSIIVPVSSVEATGRNKIPLAVAEALASGTGAELDTDIVQANSPKRTGMDGLGRLLAPPVFDGKVKKGGKYVLVDDTLTQGGTFASLASHIRENGGEVAAVVALTGKQYSAKLAPSAELLSQVRERFSNVEDKFRAATGYGFDALTESEARYLVKHDDAQSIRDRIVEAGEQASRGVDEGREGTSQEGSVGDQAFSRRSNRSESQQAQVESVEKMVANLTRKWKNAPKIHVLASMDEAPQSIRDKNARDVANGAEGEPDGFYSRGEAYVLVSKVNTQADVARVVFHEVLGHHGLRGVFGGALRQVLRQVYQLRRDEVVDIGLANGLDMNEPEGQMKAAEEWLAYAAQSKPTLGFVRRAVAAIRTWLRENVGHFAGLKVTNDEIIRNFIVPARGFVQRGRIDVHVGLEPAFSREDAGTPMFSRAPTVSQAISQFDQKAVRDRLSDIMGAVGKVTWWDKTVGTQYNKAQRWSEYRPVFEKVQNYIQDTSTLANGAADMAPDILPKTETWRDAMGQAAKLVGQHGKHMSPADSKAIGAPIFEGTLDWARDSKGNLISHDDLIGQSKKLDTQDKAQALLKAGHITDHQLKSWQGMPLDDYTAKVNEAYERDVLAPGVVFTDAELRDKFNLNDKQIGLYRQFLASVNKSLDQAVSAEVMRLLGKNATPKLKDMALAGDSGLRDAIETHLTDLTNKASTPAQAKELTALWNDVADKFNHIEDMKKCGYAPLTRFGQNFVHAMDDSGETQYFGLFESEREANKMRRELADQFPKVEVGKMSQEYYKLMAGVPMDAMEVFANAVGADQSEVFQQYLRLAKNNRSTMKRLIRRKGTAGFSEDVSRVLASFVTGNARMASGTMNMVEAKDAASQIKTGDIKDEAVKLIDAVENPAETSAAARGLMFTHFIGGSVASALVNTTQPIMMTLPYLSQWGGLAKAGKRLAMAAKMAVGGEITDKGLAQALKRAEQDGAVSPQEIHHLQATAMASFGTNPFLKTIGYIWGAPFALAEQFNRRATFIAAYQTAVEEGIANPEKFAEQAITETQGLYNKGNAANWTRNPAGAVAMTFKQYTTHYLEWIIRMYKSGPEGKRAAITALALLAMAAGGQGLPFMDDLDDLIDTAAQAMGYNFSSKKAKRDFIANTLGLGDTAAMVAMRGLSSLPGVPIDVSARMGMSNILPGTGMFLRSNTDRTNDVMEFAGAAGGLAKSYIDGGKKLLTGDVIEAGKEIAPTAIKNIIQAVQMWRDGEYRDRLGRKVMDVGPLDGAAKFIGFQPAEVAQESSAIAMAKRSIDLAKVVESEITSQWAQGLHEKDPDQVQAAREKLKEWNATNPDAHIGVTMQQVRRRVAEMRKTREERFIKSAPKEMRQSVKAAIS